MKFNFGFFKSLAVGSLLATSAFADTELTVYTAVEAEDLTRYAAKFNESHPDIKINWVRDSTGIITAKLLACLLYTSPSPRDGLLSRMPSSA